MFQVISIPALSDNYIWIISDNHQAIIIDPAEDQKVLDYLGSQDLNPVAILLTHNHADHTDGVAGIKAVYPDLPVYGSSEVAEFANHIVADGDRFALLGHRFEVIKSAGHTAEHISYLMDLEHLFCGDSLFSAGCGRVFTGDYQAQYDALQRFKKLPDIVQVYAGHEYTLTNLRFAETVLPPSCGLFEHQELAQMKREQGKPTLPTTIGVEMQINPFLRAESLDEFIRLRTLRDNF